MIGTLHARLGWANRWSKHGLEAYGPRGRWDRTRSPDTSERADDQRTGDLLGDALAELGAGEGTRLLVLALPPGTTEAQLERLDELVTELLGTFPELAAL